MNEKVIRRLLDLDHQGRIERIEQALALLGRGLELSVRPHAPVANSPRR